MCNCPPPGKELDEFTIEFKFSSTDTHSGPYTSVTHPTFFTNAINNYYFNPFTTIGTRNGYLFFAPCEYTSDGRNAVVYYTGKLVCDGKSHNLAITLKEGITKIYLDNTLIINDKIFEKFYNNEILFGSTWYYSNWNNNIDNSSFKPNTNFNLLYFKLYDKAIDKKDFFNIIEYKPIYFYPGFHIFTKNNSKTYLKDYYSNIDLRLIDPVDCKSDMIFSNISIN